MNMASPTKFERLKNDLSVVLFTGSKSDVNVLVEILTYLLGFRQELE